MRAKTLFLSVVICAMSKAQISLENAYPATSQYQNMSVVELVKSGYKYQLVDLQSKYVKLYNLNHSLFKSIPLPVPAGLNLTAAIVSDSLFNTDNLVEVAYYYSAYTFTNTPVTYTTETKVINENGTSLFTLPQGGFPSVFFAGGANGYKMIINVDSVNKTSLKQMNVYSLPGGYPAHCCKEGGAGPVTGLKEGHITHNLSGPVPNPSNGKTVIGYQLPTGETTGSIMMYDLNGKEVRRYQVDSNFNTLELDNTDLPSGTYFYQISGSSEAKKMVIIK